MFKKLSKQNKGGDCMAFEYSKLKGKIVEKFGTQGAFAKALGLSQRSLSFKLQGKVFFRQDEIDKSINLLGIEPADINKYFFCPKCSSF